MRWPRDGGTSGSAAACAVTSPAPRGVWREALSGNPDAVATQTPEWVDWLGRTRGYRDASRLYEFPSGRRLVLPLAAKAYGSIPLTEDSMPYGFGYGGALACGGGPTVAEARAVLADLARRPAARTTVVPMPLTAGIWAAAASGAARVPYVSQVLDLAGGFGEVWSRRFRRDTRTKVRSAANRSLDIRVQAPSTVEAFAYLNRLSVDRWARQRGQRLVVARLVERRRDRARQLADAWMLGELCVTRSAHWKGEPVAAYATLHFGEHVLFWMSAMDRRLADETRAGYLLQSLAIEAACRAGARYFHLGESDPGSGVERFKAGFGARRVEYEALCQERLPISGFQRRIRAVGAARMITGKAS